MSNETPGALKCIGFVALWVGGWAAFFTAIYWVGFAIYSAAMLIPSVDDGFAKLITMLGIFIPLFGLLMAALLKKAESDPF